MNFQEKAAHAELYQKLKNKQNQATQDQKKCDIDFYQCRKEMQSKIYRFGKYLESNFELESQNFITTWLSFNASRRTKKLRRDGIYQQYEYPQNFRNLEDYLIKLTIFEEPSPWFWRITEQFRKNIPMSDIDDVLTAMQLTLKGFFQEGNIRITKIIPNQPFDRYQCCFSQQFKQKFVILFEVVVEIYPLFNKLNQFQGRENKHTMIFYNILSQDNYSEQHLIYLTKRYLDNQSQYHRDNQFSGKANGVYRECYQKELFVEYYNINYHMQDLSIGGKILYTCSEFLHKQRYVPKDKINQYRYSDKIGAWVYMELNDPQMKKIKIQQITDDFCKRFDSTLQNGQLMKLLEITKLNIEMTDQEKKIVGNQGNLLVIGRSGTGKTTCAILRIFGLELLFRLRMSNFKKRNQEMFNSEGISENDLDIIGLKCIFVTASPVLANQVKKYYQALNDKLNEQITKINKNHLQKSEYSESDENIREDDEEKFMEELNKFDSLDEMQPNDFPAFFTIRKLIQMIDGSLQNPFFQRFKNHNSDGPQLLSRWHSESNGVVNQSKRQQIYSESDSDHEQHSKVDLNTNVKQVSQEVTYEVFQTEFWPTLKIYSQKIKGINSGLLWTHIYSYIKGSSQSHQSQNQYLDFWRYYNLKDKLMLKKHMMKQIYDLFIQYEQWKTDNKYYDLMDAVNYILAQTQNQNTHFHKIHYLMVDEVQDLPDNILLLLLKVTQFSTVFSGDTAQNIAKGVGFRFQDLNSLFKQQAYESELKELKEFKKYQLTINFRSHNNILQLANSVISVLELCFPKSIDILDKEKSNLIGPKPIIIYSQETLFMILNGTKEESQFGCNQVILVKDQESKEQIPQMLKHALVLTIYEAKGLEFNDVLLYNFFNDATDQWSILEKLTSENQLVDIQQFNNTITLHNQGVDTDENIYGYQKIDDKYLIKKLKFNRKTVKFDLQQYSLLCNDLKQLYVAITRTKNRFIIYDQDSSNREGLQKIWNNLKLVDIYLQNDIPQDLQNQILQTSSQEWQDQGKMLFKNKFYLQSMKCFKISGDDYWYKKANAYYLASEGTILFSQLNNKDKNQMNQQKYKELFRDASKLFIETLNPKEAAKCLYSAGDYLQALQIYQDQGWIKQAAEAAYQSKLYSKSGDLFFQINDYSSAMDAYENAQDWDGLFKILLKLKTLSDPNIQTYLKKYLIMVLKSIQEKLGETDKQETQNIKIKEILRINEIYENPEKGILKHLNNSQNDSNDKLWHICIDQQLMKEFHKQQSDINDQIQPNQQNEDEFSIISHELSVKSQQNKSNNNFNQNQDQSVSFILDASQNDLEGLSNNDDNQWLKIERNSSIISMKSQIISDFSIISQNQVQNDSEIQLVKNKCNIDKQDEMMYLIIKWLSIYSEKFNQQLIQLRSRFIPSSDVEMACQVTLDLDQIDIEFVNLILNLLEQFQMFKLCILVCNRYELVDKVTRFIISIAAQQSPIFINPSQILMGVKSLLNKYKQKGIEVSKTMYSVLENININILPQPEQLLRQLILLGYWKQAANQLSFDDAQNIFSLFEDFKNWKRIYFKNIITQLQIKFDNEQDRLKKNNIQGKLLVCQKKYKICSNCDPQDLFYFNFPNDEQEILFSINTLQHMYVELDKENLSLKKIKLPQFLVNTEQIWNSIQQDKLITEQVLISVCQNFVNYTQLFQLYESSLFLITFVKYINNNQNSNIAQQYQKGYSNKTVILIRDCLQLIINSFRTSFQTQKDQILLDSILLLNKISLPKGELFKHFNQYILVCSDSKILEKLIKKKETQIKKKCYFIDIDFQFLIAPINDIMEITEKSFKLQIQTLFRMRQQYFSQNNYSDRDQAIEYIGTIIANRYNNCYDVQYISQSQQLKCDVKLLLDYEDNNSISGLVNQLIHKIMISNYVCNLEPTVKVKLIELALSYLNQSKLQNNEIHNNIIKGIIILNFVQRNYYLYLFIDQIQQQNGDLKYYHKYLEYLLCRKYSIISDASECYFEYYDIFKTELNVDEVLNDLTYLFVHQLISLKYKVYLPQILINYIDQPLNKSIKKPIYLSNEDHLNLTMQCLIENFQQIILFAPQQILLIVISYVINIEVIPIQILKQLQYLRNQQVLFILDNIQYQTDNKMQNIFPNSQLDFIDNQEFFEFRIENTLNNQQLQKNYQDSLNEQEFITKQGNNLTQIANKIKKQWNIYKQKNTYHNIKKCLSQTNQRKLKISTSRSDEQIWTKLQDKINLIRMNLIEIIYTMKLEIEFHFIHQKLEELSKIEQQYFKNLQNYLNNQVINISVFEQLCFKQLKELQIFENFLLKVNENLDSNEKKIAI